MRRDPKLLRMLRDATREAAQSLDNLRLLKPEYIPEVAALKKELRKSLATNVKSLAEDARTTSRQAKQSSARHRQELLRIKRMANEAAAKAAAKLDSRRKGK
jgi:gas vesicle protein